MILVTGAGGALGRLVAGDLAGQDDVVLGSRTPRSAGERRVDFDDPGSLDFTGVDTLLLISAGYGEDDVVVARHGAAISAAEKAGVRHVVYTSLSGDGDHLPYALAHRWTERRLQRSALAWTVLRNGLYAEFLADIAAPGPDGTITAPLGDGRLAAVARADLAAVAARVVSSPKKHAGKVYELGGERALGGAELAAAIGGAYAPAALGATREAIIAGGAALPYQVPMLVGTYSAIAGGFLDGSGVEGSSLRGLLGRAPQSALEVYRRAAAAASGNVR
ncbi:MULTISPECIES: NAD(P)H-binding protein [unclassified Streptomyces]|uniref:NAD(P)H-binding protein n=1 Tax=unclassified Streptomyces TaxID=2593676 RepID=UPI0022570255|nr:MULTISPECIES: NAD(P)H-binding protein [unclassified Streptomyces]MCX5330784.1 NAD(P)H-binding protein [Streptomyces sp. NBC_00140]MCX5360181.1 NAD(P)H-binding protein [Streptomyces sp. NBC_00124]